MFFIVTQLHREFLRAGSDVIQAFTFGASDERQQYIDSEVVREKGVRTHCLLQYGQ